MSRQASLFDAPDPFAGWKQDRIGCHWTRGLYVISTESGGREPSGYVLTVHRTRIGGRYPDFAAAALAATLDGAESLS